MRPGRSCATAGGTPKRIQPQPERECGCSTALCRLLTALCRLFIAQCHECGLPPSSGMLLCNVEALSLHRAAWRLCSVLFCHGVRDAVILNLHRPSHAHAMFRITAAWILSLTLGLAVQEGGRRRGLPGAAALP